SRMSRPGCCTSGGTGRSPSGTRPTGRLRGRTADPRAWGAQPSPRPRPPPAPDVIGCRPAIGYPVEPAAATHAFAAVARARGVEIVVADGAPEGVARRAAGVPVV